MLTRVLTLRGGPGHLIRYLYSFFFYLLLPCVLLRKLWRAQREPDYAKRWHERFAWKSIPTKYRDGIWLHAVSLGEYIAAKPLLLALQKAYPSKPFIVTTTTPVASRRVQSDLGNSVFHCYLPYDLPSFMARFLKQLQPIFVVIMETELWPNLFYQCAKHKIPIVMANARLSQRSVARYGMIKPLLETMWPAVKAVAAQSLLDHDRFIDLNLAPSQVVVAGNLKFNQSVPPQIKEKGLALRACWGGERLVWIAASTHDGEEEQVLNAHKKILEFHPTALLLLVPRHPDRFFHVIQCVRDQGYVTQQRSDGSPTTDCQVFVGDTMGEMMLFYAASNVAFVAGSLMPIGGHNPLEPIALGVPVVMGPHIFKMQAMGELLLSEKAMQLVNDSNQLADQIIQLFLNPSNRMAFAQRGLQLLSDNQNALAKHLNCITRSPYAKRDLLC